MKVTALTLLFSLLVTPLFAQYGMISRKLDPDRKEIWTLDGEEFTYEGAPKRDKWIWDGESLKPEDSKNKREFFQWDGEYLMPEEGDEDYNTVFWNGTEMTIKDSNVDPRRYTFDEEKSEWCPVQGVRSKNTWVVEGDLPPPLVAFVIYDLTNARRNN